MKKTAKLKTCLVPLDRLERIKKHVEKRNRLSFTKETITSILVELIDKGLDEIESREHDSK